MRCKRRSGRSPTTSPQRASPSRATWAGEVSQLSSAFQMFVRAMALNNGEVAALNADR